MMSRIVIATLLMVASVQAVDWSKFDDDEKPYEHDFKNIPDLIDIPEVQFWFNLTHFFLQGIERGMYGNDSLTLNEDCFGPRFVTKINEFAAMA